MTPAEGRRTFYAQRERHNKSRGLVFEKRRLLLNSKVGTPPMKMSETSTGCFPNLKVSFFYLLKYFDSEDKGPTEHLEDPRPRGERSGGTTLTDKSGGPQKFNLGSS